MGYWAPDYFARSYFPNQGTTMSIQSDFNVATGDDTTVVTDTAAVSAAQQTLDAATTTDLNDHATLVADVVAKGPTLVTATMSDGSTEYVALLPQADGTISTVVLFFEGAPPPAMQKKKP